MHRGEDEGQPVGCHAVPHAAVRAVGITGHAAKEGEEEGGQRAGRPAELLADLRDGLRELFVLRRARLHEVLVEQPAEQRLRPPGLRA